MNTTAILSLHCPDKQGILAEVTNFITVNKGNIIYLDQYVDHAEKTFFMRIEWELNEFLIPKEKIYDYFDTLYANKQSCSKMPLQCLYLHNLWLHAYPNCKTQHRLSDTNDENVTLRFYVKALVSYLQI